LDQLKKLLIGKRINKKFFFIMQLCCHSSFIFIVMISFFHDIERKLLTFFHSFYDIVVLGFLIDFVIFIYGKANQFNKLMPL